MLRQLPAIVWTVDRDLVFTSSKGSGLQQLGLQPGQVVGQTLFEYFGTEDPDYLPIQLHRRALAGEPQEYEFETNGRHYRVRLEPLRNPSGEIVGVVGIAFDVTEQVRAQQELERMATTDPLTGLANRAALLGRLEALVRAGRSFAVLLVDLDGFKAVNDTFGHLAGDAVLRQVADRLRRTVRSDDTVGRLGGDEFLVVAPVQSREAAGELARRLLVALSQPLRIEDRTVSLGGSIGVLFCADGACPARDVLRDADLALYEAKRRGKGRIVFYHSGLVEETQRELMLTQSLQEAVNQAQIDFVGVPLVELQSGKLVGFEVVPRWSTPAGDWLSGPELAAAADRAGVDLRLAHMSLEEASTWLDHLPDDSFVLVGFPSPALLDPDAWEGIEREDARSAKFRRRLWLDLPMDAITATNAQTRFSAFTQREIGIVVRDPVLTPRSMAALSTFPRAGLRIPCDFVHSFLHEQSAAALTRALLQIARDLGLLTLAEGIDETATLVALARSGCRLGTGALFGPPQSRDEGIELARAASSYGERGFFDAAESAHAAPWHNDLAKQVRSEQE